jgi:hypothetical protein
LTYNPNYAIIVAVQHFLMENIMFNAKLIENMFDSTFKTEQFYKNLSSLQSQFIDGYQKLSTFVEDNNKKTKEYWEAYTNTFTANNLVQKAEEIRKLNEDNYNKVKAYVEQSSKLLNGEQLLSQIKKITKTIEENNLKAIKSFEQNTALMSSSALLEEVEKARKVAEENQKKVVAYFTEQYNFWNTFQNDLLASIKSEDPTKDFPEAVKKYSKAVATANLKKIDENLEVVKKAVV